MQVECSKLSPGKFPPFMMHESDKTAVLVIFVLVMISLTSPRGFAEFLRKFQHKEALLRFTGKMIAQMLP